MSHGWCDGVVGIALFSAVACSGDGSGTTPEADGAAPSSGGAQSAGGRGGAASGGKATGGVRSSTGGGAGSGGAERNVGTDAGTSEASAGDDADASDASTDDGTDGSDASAQPDANGSGGSAGGDDGGRDGDDGGDPVLHPVACQTMNVPTCGFPDCFAWCDEGTYPCPTGCCSEGWRSEYYDQSGLTAPSIARMVDAAHDWKGTAYVTGSAYDQLVFAVPPFSAKYPSDPELHEMQPTPDGEELVPTFTYEAESQVAIAPSDGSVYLAGAFWLPDHTERFRLAQQSGAAGWTFEDAPGIGDLSVDKDGRVLVGTWMRELDHVWRSDTTVVHSAVAVNTVDETGAFVIAMNSPSRFLRYAGGEWKQLGAELPFAPGLFAFSGGATHFAGGYNYARRDASGDHAYVFSDGSPPLPPLADPKQVVQSPGAWAMAVDPCGPPHFLMRYGYGYSGWDGTLVAYVRWTSAGWRGQSLFGTSCPYPNEPLAITVAGDRVYLGTNDCYLGISSFPR